MRVMQSIPADYAEIYVVNLQKDKRTAIWVNVLALSIFVVMAVSASYFVPISTLFNMDAGILNYAMRFIVLMISIPAYLCLHELIHGITMKMCGTEKVKFGFTGLYAFAGSDAYYDKKSYILIALAPVVIFLVILTVANLLAPRTWFWVIYFIQICNVSGAAGDLFLSVKIAKMPKEIVIRDRGVIVTVYGKR